MKASVKRNLLIIGGLGTIAMLPQSSCTINLPPGGLTVDVIGNPANALYWPTAGLFLDDDEFEDLLDYYEDIYDD